MGNKPKKNYTDQPEKDRFQTPAYALKPLIPYLDKSWRVWESAVGEGYLKRGLEDHGFLVAGTDVLDGFDYFFNEVDYYDIQITNPPYSLKYEWLERAYQLGKPFALLMPGDTLLAQRGQKLFTEYGYSVLIPNRRVDFKTPFRGWKSSAQFTSAWFCWKIPGMSEGVTFVDMMKERITE